MDVNGHVFEGEFRNGMRNGEGRQSYHAGQAAEDPCDVYEGEWKDDMRWDGGGECLAQKYGGCCLGV